MRIIPRRISNKTRSRGERLVFAALESLPDASGVALHSVLLPEHEYKRVGELDFVLITPQLLLFIEVKGGRIRRGSDGVWEYLRRDGHIGRSEEGPFGQASSGMHAFERLLGEKVGNLRRHGVASGYLVITPDVDLPESTEYAAATYLGGAEFDGGRGLARGIHKAADFWLRQNRWARTPIPPELRSAMLAAIRPEFDRVPSLRARVAELDERFERLTSQQLVGLDQIAAENPRLLWRGGAGSGKTFLAVEAARRWSEAGKVLVTCASKPLAAYLARRLPDPNITVLPFDSLAGISNGTFDRLIVDEAQDLMTAAHLDLLGGLLKGNLDNGHWIFTLDRNNQVLAPEGFDEDTYQYLSSVGIPLVLSRNCRNTEDIVAQVRTYTGADLGVATAGKGEPVRYEKVASADAEAAALDRYLDALLDGQLSPRDITLVSLSGDWETTSIRRSRRFPRIQRFADAIGRADTGNRITWASVQDIKGLENRVICLVDVEPALLEGRLDAVYVAFTRARAQLWIACRPGVIEVFARLGRERLLSGGAR